MAGIWLVIAVSLLGSSVDAGGLTAEEVLRSLKSRDAQFDNARLHYTSTSQVTRDAPSSFNAMKSGELTPVAEQPQAVIDFTYNESMIVRGKEVTFERTLANSTHQSGDPSIQMLPAQKWSNRGEDLKELTDDGTDARYSKILEFRPKADPVSLFDEQRMEIEFAFGFGFGTRIKTIESLRKDGDQYEVTGTIQIWWADISTFHLLLDKNLIARHAEIDCDVSGNLTRFEISTEGTVGERFLFAETGRLTRKWMGLRKEGVTRGEPKVKKQFAVAYKNVDWDLSDATYSSITAITPDDNTQVIDHTGNHSKSHVDRLPEERRLGIGTTVVVANSVALIAILAAWVIMRRLRQRKGGP